MGEQRRVTTRYRRESQSAGSPNPARMFLGSELWAPGVVVFSHTQGCPGRRGRERGGGALATALEGATEEQTAIQTQTHGFRSLINPGSEGARSRFVVPADSFLFQSVLAGLWA